MTAGQFRECVKLTRWTQAMIAEELGVLPVKVRKWSAGFDPVPDVVGDWITNLSIALEAVYQSHHPPLVPVQKQRKPGSGRRSRPGAAIRRLETKLTERRAQEHQAAP
jgi:hypothetical protein